MICFEEITVIEKMLEIKIYQLISFDLKIDKCLVQIKLIHFIAGNMIFKCF